MLYVVCFVGGLLLGVLIGILLMAALVAAGRPGNDHRSS
jgi:hypothetical protein